MFVKPGIWHMKKKILQKNAKNGAIRIKVAI